MSVLWPAALQKSGLLPDSAYLEYRFLLAGQPGCRQTLKKERQMCRWQQKQSAAQDCVPPTGFCIEPYRTVRGLSTGRYHTFNTPASDCCIHADTLNLTAWLLHMTEL